MAAIVEQQPPAQATHLRARFWKGLVSHRPLKRFFDWLFAGLAIVTVPLLIICSIIIAGELSAPAAFTSEVGQWFANAATILMNAAIEGAMLGCVVAARRAGSDGEKKRLHAMGITFLLLTIATIGFAVFHADRQWDLFLLLVRCAAGLIFCYISHMSESVGSGTKKQDMVDFEGQSVLKKRSLSW
jgi:hypothetical protein